MEEEEALRTVECLRGRLLAERAASRTANETAQLKETKLKELEEKLKIETKSRKRAEKRLNLLKKKLESLNISYSEDSMSQQSSSSENFANCSCISSTASTDREEIDPENKNKNNISAVPSEDAEEKIEEGSQTLEKVPKNLEGEVHDNNNAGEFSTENHLIEEKSANPDEDHNDPSHENQVAVLDSSSKPSMEEMENDNVDNSMALVPVTTKEKSTKKEVKVTSENVRQVLDNLKQIRENLQSTLQRRRLIQVG